MKVSITSLYNWYSNTISNPKYRWWIVFGTLAYLISPLDIAPDLIPIVGQIDDLVIVTILITELSKIFFGGFESPDQSQQESQKVDKNLDDEDVKTVDVKAETVETESI